MQRNAKIGLMLFAVYLVLYGGFALLSVFSPDTMENTPAAGVNLAVWYGFGLIVGAIVIALIYGWLCREDPNASRAGSANLPADAGEASGGPQ